MPAESNSPAPAPKTEAELALAQQERVKSFIQANGIKAWNQEANLRFIMAEIRAAFPEIGGDAFAARRKALCVELERHGFGGNASQARQWLEKEKLITKAPSVEDRYGSV